MMQFNCPPEVSVSPLTTTYQTALQYWQFIYYFSEKFAVLSQSEIAAGLSSAGSLASPNICILIKKMI
jgi:hypothetical protein